LYSNFPLFFELSFDSLDAAVSCLQIFAIGSGRFKVSCAKCLMSIFAIFRHCTFLERYKGMQCRIYSLSKTIVIYISVSAGYIARNIDLRNILISTQKSAGKRIGRYFNLKWVSR